MEHKNTQITPITEAAKCLAVLSDVWEDIQSAVGSKNKSDFFEDIFGKIWADGTTGEDQKKSMESETDEEIKSMWILHAIFIGCSLAADAMKAKIAGNDNDGWGFAMEAAYWCGLANGAWSVRRDGPSVRQASIRGSEKRHSENRAIKAFVMAWLDANKDLNLNGDSTATEIASGVAPIKWRTARDYIIEWKKLRSNVTP